MTTTTKATWVNLNGEMVCDKHGGKYLAASIAESPKANAHRTPMTVWDRITVKDHALWNDEFGTDCLCEYCS